MALRVTTDTAAAGRMQWHGTPRKQAVSDHCLYQRAPCLTVENPVNSPRTASESTNHLALAKGSMGKGGTVQLQPNTLPEGAQLSGVLPLTVLVCRVAPPELT